MDAQSGGEYSRLTGDDPAEIKNSKVIQQIAIVGYNDYTKRLRAEGIDLVTKSSVLANVDKIKESLVEYVQLYMTSKEGESAVNEILIGLKDLSKDFLALPANGINVNSVKKYFLDAATIRANVLFKLKTKLPSPKKSTINNMSSLMDFIPENHEIVLPTSLATWTVAPDQAWAFIRKDGVYITNLPDDIKKAVADGTINAPDKTKITHKNISFDVYRVRSARYLNEIYNEWINRIGGAAPDTLDGYTMPINAEL
jgi:hypothetical protein